MSKQVAFVFPGQGSQKIGMLADIAAAYPTVLDTFAEASEALGYELWTLCQQGSQQDISKTEVTQPLLLTASVALYRLWLAEGGAEPHAMAGHSLGEWSALVCGGVIGFSDAVKLVQSRGRYMQEAVPEGLGGMAAVIGLSDELIDQACNQASQRGTVCAVNYNAPGQTVIAGHKEAVEEAGLACKELGAKRVLPLPVSGPFHTPLMQPAQDALSLDMENIEFSPPTCPIIQNVTCSHTLEPGLIKERILQQITSPVPWVACVTALSEMGVDEMLECGPGNVLCGMVKRIDRSVKCYTIQDESGFLDALKA